MCIPPQIKWFLTLFIVAVALITYVCARVYFCCCRTIVLLFTNHYKIKSRRIDAREKRIQQIFVLVQIVLYKHTYKLLAWLLSMLPLNVDQWISMAMSRIVIRRKWGCFMYVRGWLLFPLAINFNERTLLFRYRSNWNWTNDHCSRDKLEFCFVLIIFAEMVQVNNCCYVCAHYLFKRAIFIVNGHYNSSFYICFVEFRWTEIIVDVMQCSLILRFWAYWR